jgi:hypothetical protein
MPKLKQTFIRGRMNKDLDERLVPKGEYRDGQNIQVSTSEGNDVGAIENVLGNTKQNNKPGGGTWQTTGSGTTPFGLTNAKCIGTVRDSQNEKIYWFLTSNTVDAILEYDQTTGIVSPVLVDTNNVLNFSDNNLITGINILDGMLFWTDDLNEPRVINIAKFKTGSAQSGDTLASHTHVYGDADPSTRDFIATDITVIKSAPTKRLTVKAYSSAIPSVQPTLLLPNGNFRGVGVNPITLNAVNLSGKVAGNTIALAWTSQNIQWAGDKGPDCKVILKYEINEDDGTVTKYQVIGVFGSSSNLTNSSGTLTISSLSDNIVDSAVAWTMLRTEDEPIFKNDFPRFSYRYKFTDSRYSPYAPFTKPAFVPGQFEYLSRDGYNLGMDDNTRIIYIEGFPGSNGNTIPADVEEVEILYKGSRSNNVYLVKSFDRALVTAINPYNTTVTTDLLGRVIESSQLLRLFDGVPKKAKSQEVIGNRVIYGNYLQNYDVVNSDINIVGTQSNTAHSSIGLGKESVKSDRTYQIGVTFLDEYGRESPVFTSPGGAVAIDKTNADKVNAVIGSMSNASTTPSWATKFKFYVKNSTPEYYNLGLDRYYSAEDGNVWLSFPSSERNKIQDGDYINLKKQHDSDTPVKEDNRYKVLDISNEAPPHIKNVKTAIARSTVKAYKPSSVLSSGFIVGDNRIKFYGPLDSIATDSNNTPDSFSNANFFNNFKQGGHVSFTNASGAQESDTYKIVSGGPTGAIQDVGGLNMGIYEVILDKNIVPGDDWLQGLVDAAEFRMTVFEDKNRFLPEFEGKFFAKINPNATFIKNVESAFVVPGAENLVIDTSLQLLKSNLGSITSGTFLVSTVDIYNPDRAHLGVGTYTPLLPGNSTEEDKFDLAAARTESVATNKPFKAVIYYEKLVTGAKIKFGYIDGTQSADFYTIINTDTTSIAGLGDYDRDGINQGEGIATRYQLDRDFDDTQYGGTPSIAQIGKIIIYRQDTTTDRVINSSTNPAIFETEPQKLADLDIFYEASSFIDISTVKTPTTIAWSNCYSFGNGVESDRIRDDFNAPVIGKGVRVSAVLEEPYREERRSSSMIFSGIFNSISGINNTNQFLLAENITQDLNPTNGSIQKLHARDTDLIALCEDKCFRILANKDALFNADGSTNVTSNKNVLGQAVPFAGEFGISKNPESFASFGFRSYFTDKARGAVIRLSRDGITVISDKSMSYYFNQQLKAATQPLIGSYDEDTGTYNVRLNNKQLSFLETVDGWTTRLTYAPEGAISLNTEYYTFKEGEMWEHSNATTRANFYGTQENTTVTTIINDGPSSIKNFKTLSYEGDEGWTATISTKDQNGVVNTWKDREGIYFNFIEGNNTTLSTKNFSTQGISTVSSTITGNPLVIDFTKDINVSVQVGDTLYYHRSNVSAPIGLIQSLTSTRITAANSGNKALQNNDFLFVSKPTNISTSGLTGYYSTIVMTNTSAEKRELFAVNAEAFISSE